MTKIYSICFLILLVPFLSFADVSGPRPLGGGTATTAEITSGTIDGTTIGGTTPAAGTFTQVTGTSNLYTESWTITNDGSWPNEALILQSTSAANGWDIKTIIASVTPTGATMTFNVAELPYGSEVNTLVSATWIEATSSTITVSSDYLANTSIAARTNLVFLTPVANAIGAIVPDAIIVTAELRLVEP